MAKEPYPSETADRYIVRFPDGMRDLIAEFAKENNRSMNAEIVSRLDESLRESLRSRSVESQILNLLGSLNDADKSVILSVMKNMADVRHSPTGDQSPTTILNRFTEGLKRATPPTDKTLLPPVEEADDK
ncbi:Arc family DNA-binding protein [Brucella sp. BO3]|uniref:Arc family DNA-binding protein n=1 Tax=unclassified Brucella TaxID=2632610 RepID=UPI00086DF9DD|nr:MULTISPECIES: Arc family DNA-binding protein [unclassified Brucella]OEI82498.1 hypothetical protein BA060_12110 [Brucella sp. B13-0095]QMV26322.1 Arc family DNA-binding protein [Brucella sp. BO3]